MDISTEPDVVGQVPADVVGVFKDRDVVAVPQPVADVAYIEWGDVEVEATKPEPARTATAQTPDMAAAKTTREMIMFPGMVDVEAGVVASLIVAHPLAVVVDVWGFGMAFLVAEILFRSILMGWRSVRRWRAMARHVAAADAVTSALVSMLSPKGQRKNERKSEEPES